MYRIFPVILLLWGCGSSPEDGQQIPKPVPGEAKPTAQTPYGDATQVQAYLNAINPYVQEVGKIQLEIDKQVGSSGQATGANLAPAMEEVKPRLQKALEEFSTLSPPPLLAPLHDDIKKLMVLRLTGYDTTIRGWAREQQDGNTEIYAEAMKSLDEANLLIRKLNDEMAKVYKAMEQVPKPAQTASP